MVLNGTYEIIRIVGWGGMGEVYEARHARLPGRFAIKVLSKQVAVDSIEFLRFRREAEITSSLRHPHIVQVLDFNHMEDGTPYLAMEFLEGRDLRTELEARPRMSPARVADVVAQIASALSAAHSKGIVHRDLKPQNVFLTPVDGERQELVKILDFGISKVRSNVDITTESRVIGTPQYMSPEQAHGQDQVDGATDQFALAAIAYEMLGGKAPFRGDSVPAILLQVTSQDPPPLAWSVPDVSPKLDAVLRRGLSKEKGARFETVTEFSEAFRAALIVGRGTNETKRRRFWAIRSAGDPDPTVYRSRIGVALAVVTIGVTVWFVMPTDPRRLVVDPSPVPVSPAPGLLPSSEVHATTGTKETIATAVSALKPARPRAQAKPRRAASDEPTTDGPAPAARAPRGTFLDDLSSRGSLPDEAPSPAETISSRGTFVQNL